MTAALPPSVVKADQGKFGFHPRATLERWPGNPRQNFNEIKIAELAKSFAGRGMLEPILARPHPKKTGQLEIAAGERRWRAAELAHMEQIPVIVRNLDDKEMLEIATIENAQREDLHPLEQADGYERLIKEHGYTPEKIADAIGKSRAHVFQIRKLRSLAGPMRKAFVDGEMDTTLATVIARVPSEAMQITAWQDLKRQFHQGFSFRVAADFIRRNYMLDLARAPFNIQDANLNPKAGTCGGCPKRTGNQPDLFPDVKNGNVCTDPACFNIKRDAARALEIKTLEKKGTVVIVGAEAKKIMPHGYINQSSGYSEPGSPCYDDPKRRNWGQLAKLAGVAAARLQTPDTGALRPVIRIEEVKKGLDGKGIKLFRTHDSSRRQSAWAAQQRATERRHRLESAVRRKIFEKTLEHSSGKIGRQELAAIAAGYFSDIWHEFRKRIAQVFGWEKLSLYGNGIQKKIEALSEKDLGRLLIALTIVKGCSPNAGSGYAQLLAAAKRAGIKPDAIRRDLAAAAKAKSKPKPKPKPKTKAKPRRQVARFLQAMQPDATLAALVGSKPLSRMDVTKKIWGYIKRNGLQDKKQRRFINTDARLRPILNGKKRISMFEMTKALSKHLKISKGGRK